MSLTALLLFSTMRAMVTAAIIVTAMPTVVGSITLTDRRCSVQLTALRFGSCEKTGGCFDFLCVVWEKCCCGGD